MKVLLTGGRGFLGRSLRERLGPGFDVVAPTRAELDVTDGAAVDAFFDRSRFDAVIHAAVAYAPAVLETTLRGFLNVHRRAADVGCVVHFGSGGEYDKGRDLVKVREDEVGRRVPADPYGLAKLLCNELVRSSGNEVNLRLFGVYGPEEDYLGRFISNTAAKAVLGLPIVVRQDVVFDYLWVGDLVEVVRRVLQSNRPFTDANVTPTESVTLSQIVAHVADAVGHPLEVTFEQAGLNFQYTGDNARLRAAFPSLRFTPIAEGVARMVEHHRADLERLDRVALERDDYRRRCVPRPPVAG